MTMQPLQSSNINALLSPSLVLDKLAQELKTLANYCKEYDFNNPDDLNQIEANIVFLKGYYERYERLTRNGIK